MSKLLNTTSFNLACYLLFRPPPPPVPGRDAPVQPCGLLGGGQQPAVQHAEEEDAGAVQVPGHPPHQ